MRSRESSVNEQSGSSGSALTVPSAGYLHAYLSKRGYDALEESLMRRQDEFFSRLLGETTPRHNVR
jgi:hypothetical protein